MKHRRAETRAQSHTAGLTAEHGFKSKRAGPKPRRGEDGVLSLSTQTAHRYWSQSLGSGLRLALQLPGLSFLTWKQGVSTDCMDGSSCFAGSKRPEGPSF